jgi:hypothetical protein
LGASGADAPRTGHVQIGQSLAGAQSLVACLAAATAAAALPAGTKQSWSRSCEAMAAGGARPCRIGCQTPVEKSHQKAPRDTGLLAEARKRGSLVGCTKSLHDVIHVSEDAKLKAPRSNRKR